MPSTNQRRLLSSPDAGCLAWLRAAGRTLAMGGALLATAEAGALEPIDAPEPTAAGGDSPRLDSVLVASREGEPREEAEAPELEPISQVSDYEPELADPAEQNSPPHDESAGVTEASDRGAAESEPRVAVLPADGDQVLSDVAAVYSQPTSPRPARFHGVVPGESSRSDLIKAWGEPADASKAEGDTEGGEVLRYELPPFEKVEALIEGDTVSVVRVTLAEETTVAELTGRLRLTEIAPVDIADPTTGELLAVAFPEKGLTLLTTPGPVAGPSSEPTNRASVSHLVLEPLDARAFVLRAEQRAEQSVTAKLEDLRLATQVDPNDAHAHWLIATERASVGQAAPAEEAAGEAVRLAPENAAYRVTWAASLKDIGEHDQAVLEARKVLDDPASPEIARAQAFEIMGRLATLGSERIAKKAIDFHTAAIDIADRLATSQDDRERRLAKDTLVSAHLAIAREIAGREYADKVQTVATWIGRASGLAEQRIASDNGGLELRLTVAREALAALAEMRPTKDPAPWIDEAQATADQLLTGADDPLFRARIHWELGQAYQSAVRIEHTRAQAQQALTYGSRAIDELSAGAEPRATAYDAERLVGQLYFYLGAINAVHRGDHTEAVGWYDKGRPILTAEREVSEFVAPRREGEELVSMGVSYWAKEQRNLAIELTERGAELMEKGVAAGVLEEEALAVPYGNLASMHKELGNEAEAGEFRRLARGVGGQTATLPTEPKAAETTSTKPKTPAAEAATTTPAARQASRPTSQRNPSSTRQARRPTNRRMILR